MAVNFHFRIVFFSRKILDDLFLIISLQARYPPPKKNAITTKGLTNTSLIQENDKRAEMTRQKITNAFARKCLIKCLIEMPFAMPSLRNIFSFILVSVIKDFECLISGSSDVPHLDTY